MVLDAQTQEHEKEPKSMTHPSSMQTSVLMMYTTEKRKEKKRKEQKRKEGYTAP